MSEEMLVKLGYYTTRPYLALLADFLRREGKTPDEVAELVQRHVDRQTAKRAELENATEVA